jgi:hypothetical protein
MKVVETLAIVAFVEKTDEVPLVEAGWGSDETRKEMKQTQSIQGIK